MIVYFDRDEAQHQSYGATLANSTLETENLIFNQSASKVI